MNRELIENLKRGSDARDAQVKRAREVFASSRAITADISPIAESRRGFNLSRLATLPLVLAVAVAGLMDARPASADSNQPALVKDSNGNTTVLAPFNEAGSVVDFYGPQGLNVCGNFYPGPFVLTAVAYESGMGLNATGRPEAYGDIDLSEPRKSGYDPMAHNADRSMRAKIAQVGARIGQRVRGIAVILTRDAVGQQSCGLISDTDTETTVAVVPAPVSQPEQQVPVEACVGSSEAIAVPSSHGAIPVANLDANTPRKTWIRPVYAPLKADAAHNWEGIGPWAPIAVAFEPGVAHLKTFGNVGEFVIASDAGGTVSVSFMQEKQHWQDALRKPDGALNSAWQLQYTIDGLPAGAAVTPFDPDTGEQLKWPDGTPIQWAAGPLGTFSVGLPKDAEVRFGIRFCIPGQQPGVQNPEIKIRRGPNDQPGLTGENQLPNTPQVVKAGMPD